MNWDEFFIGMAKYVSQKSKDRSTKVGAVIVGANNEVLSVGFNGFPRGINDNNDAYHERPTKYMITEHAERNAIYNAARQGIKVENSTLYLPFAPCYVCTDCARAIIQSGIKKIVGKNIPFPGKGIHWDDNMVFSTNMLDEAGIKKVFWEK